MAFTPYLTQGEIEAFIGWNNTSLLDLGESMTNEEWATFIESLNNGVSSWINGTTRRISFFETEVVEYHDGQGNTGDLGEYSDSDRVYFFREQPVIDVTKVEEDVGSETGAEDWVERTMRSSQAAGEYALLTVGNFSKIRFITNVPRRGSGNLRFTYTAGYDAEHPIIGEIKLIALEMIMNFLELKKKAQEADAVRWNSSQDASNMFTLGDKRILTDDLKARLAPYQRRANMNYRAWR